MTLFSMETDFETYTDYFEQYLIQEDERGFLEELEILEQIEEILQDET